MAKAREGAVVAERQKFWVVCGNDYPAGRAYTTEASAQAYCTEQNEAQRKVQMRDMQYSMPRIYYHCHLVEVYDDQP